MLMNVTWNISENKKISLLQKFRFCQWDNCFILYSILDWFNVNLSKNLFLFIMLKVSLSFSDIKPFYVCIVIKALENISSNCYNTVTILNTYPKVINWLI